MHRNAISEKYTFDNAVKVNHGLPCSESILCPHNWRLIPSSGCPSNSYLHVFAVIKAALKSIAASTLSFDLNSPRPFPDYSSKHGPIQIHQPPLSLLLSTMQEGIQKVLGGSAPQAMPHCSFLSIVHCYTCIKRHPLSPNNKYCLAKAASTHGDEDSIESSPAKAASIHGDKDSLESDHGCLDRDTPFNNLPDNDIFPHPRHSKNHPSKPSFPGHSKGSVNKYDPSMTNAATLIGACLTISQSHLLSSSLPPRGARLEWIPLNWSSCSLLTSTLYLQWCTT